MRNLVKNTRRQFSNESSDRDTLSRYHQQSNGLFPQDTRPSPTTTTNTFNAPPPLTLSTILRRLSRCTVRRVFRFIKRGVRNVSAVMILSVLLLGLLVMGLISHTYMTDEWDRIQRDAMIGFGSRATILGGFHVVGRRDVPVDPIMLSLEDEETRVYLPRDMGNRLPDAAPPPTPDIPMSLFCPILPLTTLPPNTNPISHHSSKSARSVVYNTSGDQYAWLRSRVGAHGSWVAKLSSAMKREFSAVSDGNLGADVPLLQPLWGTLEAFTATGLTSRVLSGPPPLPKPTRECGDGSPMRPLVVLPARWVQRVHSGSAGAEGGVPILAVPPAVSLNVLTMAAQALAFNGPMAGTTPSFRVPVFATGGMHSVAAVVEAVELAAGDGTTTTHPRGELWGLLGVSSSMEAERIFRVALMEDASTAHVELRMAGSARVVRVRPECGGVGECAWCDEVTVAVPLQLRAGAAGRVLQMALWVSVTEIVCSDGGAAPRIADSLAAAVHLGTLMGSEEGVTHVVVLGEDHAVHTLAHRGGDRQFYRDGLLGGVSAMGGSVGHTFLEQALGAWVGSSSINSGGGCRGPRAVQAVVVRLESPPNEDMANATTKAALYTPTNDLVVEHHGVIFAGKTVTVPSWPMSKTRLVTNEGDACHEGHPCVRMQDMVNSIFHPFTTMEGVVSVRRRHLLPARTRRVLGVVDAAEVRDVLHHGDNPVSVGGMTRQALEAIDAVSPLAVCIEARSFAQINGLYGRGGGRWVATVEDVAGALRSRVVPAVMRHRKRVECATGGGGVVSAALRVLRVVTRHVVGYGASHAGGEEAVVGSRLSAGLRDLSLRTTQYHQQGGNHLSMDEGGGRPSLAQFVARRAPLVAASARVVRVPSVVRVTRGDAVDEATLWLLLGPRFVHAGSTSDVQGSGLRVLETSTLSELVAEAERVSRALYRIVAGAPTSVCVPDGLLNAVRAHSSAMAGYLTKGDRMPLEERLQREFSPWRHAKCTGDSEDVVVCVARGQLRHMQQMLECDAMGEWVRRVSDDMRVLTQPDMSTMYDFNAWSSYEPEESLAAESNMWLTKRFLEDSITQATTLGVALCERWGCRGNATRSHKIPVGGAAYIVERQQTDTRADVPGAESDMTRTIGMGDISNIDVGSRTSEPLRFIRHVLSTAVPPEFSTKFALPRVSIGHVLQSDTSLCSSAPEACAPFPADVTAGSIVGPLTLWQQWALRYVRILLQTIDSPGAQHRLDTTSTTAIGSAEHSVIRAQSGHARLFDGHWSEFAWGSLGARTKLSLDFALKRFLPSGDDGSGPGGAAVASLVRAQTVEAADTHMTTALRHLSATELAPMLRMPLFKEGLAAAEFGCSGESRRVVASPMPISRAVVRHLRTRSWEMGPDSVVDYLDRTKAGRLDCALRGLTWLERGWGVTGSGIVEGELYSWLAKKGNPQTIAAAANHLSFMFARDLRCVFPPSTVVKITALATKEDDDDQSGDIVSSLSDATYLHLQLMLHRRSLDLLDTSGVLVLEYFRRVETPCSSSPRKLKRGPLPGTVLSSFGAGEQVLWRIPCFGCSGFMRETMAYLPPLIEDKGIPLAYSAVDRTCMCDVPATGPSQQPRDLLVRSRLGKCDNRCMPFLKSGTTTTLDGRELGHQIWSGEWYGDSTSATAYYAQRQRYFSEPSTRQVKIVLDSINADMLYSTDYEVAGFTGVDMTHSWDDSKVSPDAVIGVPLDDTLAQTVFKAYDSLGVPLSLPSIGSDNIGNRADSSHNPFLRGQQKNTPPKSIKSVLFHLNKGRKKASSPSSPPWAQTPTTRVYRICRAMYEADRISAFWVSMYSKYCDEIWVPGNWVKRMFVNSFVVPQMEIEFVSRDTVSGPLLRSEPCLGCINMAPATSPYSTIAFDLDDSTAYGVKGVDHSIDTLQDLISEEYTWNKQWFQQVVGGFRAIEVAARHVVGVEGRARSTRMSRLILDAARQHVTGLRNGYPTARLDSGGTEAQLNKAMEMSIPVEDAIERGFAQLLHLPPTTTKLHNNVSSSRRFEVGNATHVLASRMKFVAEFDLSKIVVLPEAIDVHTMDPADVPPMDPPPTTPSSSTPTSGTSSATDDATPPTSDQHTSNQFFKPEETPHRPGLFQPGDKSYGWERWCSRKCFRGPPGNRRFIRREESFRFMSVFKWEPRKGWHGLMEAYYRAFYAPLYTNRTTTDKEPMLIVVGSSYTPKANTFESIFLSQRVNGIAKRQRWPLVSPTNTSHVDMKPDNVNNYAGRADFPCMCLVAEPVSEEDITALYRSMDAFVITTRGEGWGLPISEAMAMGLPTIATDWGGSTEFTSHGSMPAAVKATRHEMPVSYPINASIVEVPQLADGYGGEHNMRMAAPSVPHTVELLRTVYEQTPDVNQEVGRRARDVIVRQFSQAATTDMMTVRLAAVAQKLRWESTAEDEAALQKQHSRLKVSIML